MKSSIEMINGNRMIVIDGEPYLPVAFRSFRPFPSAVNQFHRSGVKLYQMQVTGRKNTLGTNYSNYGDVWVGDHQYDFSAFDRQINMFKKFAPGCKIMVMLPLDPPEWWLEAHPDCYDSFLYIGAAAFDDKWIADATDYVKAFLEYAESNYDNDIFAYSFSGGLATEWFDNDLYYQPKGKRLEAYKKYSNGLPVPTDEELCDVDGYCMRQPLSKEAVYRNFTATVTPKVIRYFAKIFKEETQFRKIIGIFYGYSDCPEKKFQVMSGIFDYEEVWRDENIDMLFSPAAYSSKFDKVRELDGASSYQYLVDSVAANNKLYLHEIDHRTHLADYPIETGKIFDSYPDAFTTIEVLRRELCAALCKGGSLWWFDFYGSYYACPELEEEIGEQIKIIDSLVKRKHKSISEIAVFADASSFGLLKEELNITIDYVRKNRNNLHKCGAPYDYYNLFDFENIDISQYKMLVFLYTPKLSENVKKYIAECTDKLKVFIHLPNVASTDKLNFSAIEELCKIKLTEKENYENARFEQDAFGFHIPVSPIFKIDDKESTPFAYYENGDVAAAFKDNIAYIGVGDVPSSVWRYLADMAGVHIYTNEKVPVYADSRFIACQFPEERVDIIELKEDGVFLEVFSGKKYVSSGKKLEFSHYPYQMMMFVKENC